MKHLALLGLAATASMQDDASQEISVPSAGFALSAPANGWAHQITQGEKVTIEREGTGQLVAATVYWTRLAGDLTASSVRDRALRSTRERDESNGVEPIDDLEIDGRPAPGFDVHWETPATGRVRIRQRHVLGDEYRYVLQVHAPEESWSDERPALERILASFRFTEVVVSQALARAEQARALASRCGSEVDWSPSWAAAAERARAEQRPILVVLRSYPGFDLPDRTQLATFMDEEVIALVRSRVVPLRLSAGDPSPLRRPEVYGLGPSTFGAAFLLCDPDGSVLLDTPRTEPDSVHLWLRSGLAGWKGDEPDRPSEPVAAAELAMDRGELAMAEERLRPASLTSAAAERARARLARLRCDGRVALAHLDAAVRLDPSSAAEVACLRCELFLRDRRIDAARRALEPALEVDDPEPRALYLASQLIEEADGVAAARPDREQLALAHPQSRWAWLAAASLEHESLLIAAEGRPRLGWPRPDVLELVVEPVAEPLSRGAADRAERAAVDWLVARQRRDGSWPSPTEIARPDSEPPDLIATAVDALATRALLQRGQEHRGAALRGLGFLLEMDAKRRADPPPVVYMDYTAWASWAQLELVADALAGGWGDEEALRRWGADLVQDLESRVRANGGWSYYVSGDAAGENKVEQSISFTTAAAIVGLLRAREAGITVPDGLVERALDCLEAMRGEDGLFAYMLHHPSQSQTRSAAPGAAGRGPACELALLRGGRADRRRVAEALDLFQENASALAAEVGKALMHAGTDTQGCHYPFFDYLMAARAARAAGEREAAEHRARVLDLVLDARLADGSFQDTPILGRTFGTAAALLTLHALGHD